jgi:hypothetical protein
MTVYRRHTTEKDKINITRQINKIDCEALQAYLLEGSFVGEILPSCTSEARGCQEAVSKVCR